MSPSPRLQMVVRTGAGTAPLEFAPDRLVCCGWVGKEKAALQAHIDELSRLGVPPPARVPIYLSLSTYLLTSHDTVEVVSGMTSGEVEYVLLCRDGEMWVTVGSDQTDRDIETKSISASKQMCGKFVARECWPMRDVAGHWDRLELRCWVTKDGSRTLYQEAALASILPPAELLRQAPEPIDRPGSCVVFSGTIATTAGVVFGEAFDIELTDPVLDRRITGGYRVSILPQFA